MLYSVTHRHRTRTHIPKSLVISLFRSSSSSSSSSPRSKYHNYYLRKRRKWPHPIYKARWHEKLSQQNAMQALRTQASSSSSVNLLSSLTESFALYNCNPTPNSYHFILKTLIQTSQFHQIHSVLNHLEKNEKFETPESIFIDLIQFYGRKNEFQEAIELFFRIPNFRCDVSVDSLNCLLWVLCRRKEGLQIVPQVLLKSRLINVRLEASSFKLGFCFDGTDWGNVIRFLVRRNKGVEALEALNGMKLDGFMPDVISYTMVLDAVISAGEFERADQVFDEMLVSGLVPDIHTYNVYVSGLCKQNKFDDGIKMVSSMEELGCKPNMITYNMLLSAICYRGELGMAHDFFKHVRGKGGVMNSEAYEMIISRMVSVGDVSEALDLLKEMVEKGLVPKPSTLDEIVSGLCQNGLVSKGLSLLTEILGKNGKH
ncbi:putative tetratricopeptide-like helical domain superfamily [Helianthus annuus]|nr:putative tetratricopeptide-like helical domain superfamily [Helianthus annuus]